MSYDRRGSSIAADMDAAIERVVENFESRDSALRLDVLVLRALSVQARLAFETTRVKERLAQHPVAMDLIQGVTSQSLVFNTLAETLTVDNCSCDYDVQRNVVMTTDVRWTLEHKCEVSKKRKKSTPPVAKKKGPMITKYKFERVREEDETIIKFAIVVAFGDEDSNPRELMHFEMACEHSYPKSYYEDKQQLPSDDEDGKSEKEEDTEEEETLNFGEELHIFRFNNEVLADIGEWMGAEDEELDPVDVIGFYMALPVHEDEWLVDERVCEILFQEGSGQEEGGDNVEADWID
ncbi:hypothetical protein PHMEG_00026708 [Phytophthora megakarya]|uniref:Nucleosome assembly protein n=1 Tax=Phytophthora megakarya TaxID=4795 RepID=A0A225V9R8_9STRA|nr:hypothetical protein PHMEG_00026708 [Phytophthora megakarya]